MIFLTLFLYLVLTEIISAEHCETFLYKEPKITFFVNNETTQICSLNGNNVLYSVVNSNSGEIKLNISLNEPPCVGDYIFELNTLNDTHTRTKFIINTDKSSGNTPITNGLSFNVIYVYTGSYKVTLKSKNGSKIWNSPIFNLTTNYVQVKLRNTVKPLRAGCYGKQEVLLRTEVIVNESIFLKPPVLKIFTVPPDIYSDSTNSFCNGNYTKNCSSSILNYTHTCDYSFGIKPGEYKIFAVIVDDPRCNYETLWTNDSYLCIYELIDCNVTTSKISSTNNSTQKIVIGSVVLTMIFASCMFFLAKAFYTRKKRNNYSYRAIYSRQAMKKINEYLIIYARESKQFETMVDRLKLLLACDDCTRVTTLYELDSTKSLDPRKWLQNKLRDNSVVIILLLNIAAVYACDSNYVYRTSHCFDYLFPYSLKLLQSYEHRSYHNLYKMLAPEANPEEFRFINTLTLYYLPQHTTDLITELQLTNGEGSQRCKEAFINECNEYRDCVLKNREYLHDIFVKKVFVS